MVHGDIGGCQRKTSLGRLFGTLARETRCCVLFGFGGCGLPARATGVYTPIVLRVLQLLLSFYNATASTTAACSTKAWRKYVGRKMRSTRRHSRASPLLKTQDMLPPHSSFYLLPPCLKLSSRASRTLRPRGQRYDFSGCRTTTRLLSVQRRLARAERAQSSSGSS